MNATAIAAERVSENPKPSLYSLLSALKAVDDEMLEVSLDDQIDLIEGGRVKVDSYKYILDKLEVQKIFYEKRAEEIEKSLQAIKGNIKRLREHLVHALRTNGFDKFTGHEYVVTVRKAPPAVEVKTEPDAKLKIRFPDFVKTEYKWDKKAILARLKAGDPLAAELAGLRESFYPQFSLVKE